MRSVPPRVGFGSADARRPGSVPWAAAAATAVAAGAVVGAAAGTGTVGRTAGSAVGATVGAAAGAAGALGPQAARNVAIVPLAKPSPASRRANCLRVNLPDRKASNTCCVSGSGKDGIGPTSRRRKHYTTLVLLSIPDARR